MLDQQKMALYWRLPVYLQEAALSAYARYLDQRYYGQGYEEWRRLFQAWRRRSCAEIEAWQSERLQSIVQLAATKVPYYRDQWRGADWRAVRSATDLAALPRLEKQSIRQNETSFIVDGVKPRKLWLEKTSGTTGTSLRIYWPMAMLPKWWALVEVTIRNAAGVAREVPRAMMGGRPVVRGDAQEPPYWRYNRRWRQLYLSAYHVSEASAAEYVRAIREHGSQWITGYGSAIAALAESALRLRLPPLRLRAAVVSGDTLLPGMRASIEAFFQCKCFDSYGQAEAVCMAMECPAGRMHVIPEAGVWEILREDGSPCQAGEVGEIVATGLLNNAMPLVRYRLGDYAAWSSERHCPCGNPNRILTSLEGRVDDYLIASGGRKIGRLSTAIKRSPTIHSAQIVQDRPGHAYLLVRPGEGYCRRDAQAVQRDIIERIGSFDLEILEAAEIPKTPQGKTALVVRLGDRPETRPIYDRLIGEIRADRPAAVAVRRAGVASADGTVGRPTKVLVMTTGHEATDARIYVKQASRLQRLGLHVTVVGKLEYTSAGAVPVLTVPAAHSRWQRFLLQPWRCLWAARSLDADIVHFHDPEMLLALPLARLWWRRSKFVYDVHEDVANLLLIRDWLPRWSKPAARLLINAVEKTLAALAHAVIGVTPPLTEKFRHRRKAVAYNFVAQEFFSLAGGKTARERNIDGIHVGTLTPERARFLADTLREFHKRRPHARSLVVGVSPAVERLLNGRLPGQSRLLPPLAHREVAAHLGNSKIGLDVHPKHLPHLQVALPVKVCEYMAAGCAVVCSSMPVLDKLLAASGVKSDGLAVIDGGAPAEYASALVAMLEKIAACDDPGASLREVAARHMAWEGEADKITALYAELLGRPCAA